MVAPGGHVLAGAADVLARHDGGVDADLVALPFGVLLADDRGGAGGNRGAGGDADRLAVADGAVGGGPGAGLSGDPERAPGGAGDHRVAVHRRAREGGDVPGRADVVGEDSVERVGDGYVLGGQRMDRGEHGFARLRDGQKRSRHSAEHFCRSMRSSNTRER